MAAMSTTARRPMERQLTVREAAVPRTTTAMASRTHANVNGGMSRRPTLMNRKVLLHKDAGQHPREHDPEPHYRIR